jgi:hypothetical protein
MSPDESLLRLHMTMAPFQMGLDQGKWGWHNEAQAVRWPYVLLWIHAASKPGLPDKYSFRFQLDGYPQQAPTACPWDMELDVALPANQWPKGPQRVSKVFAPHWKATALYCPCDRIAMVQHDQWQQQYPDLWWRSDFTIVKYLDFVHWLLNSRDYLHG